MTGGASLLLRSAHAIALALAVMLAAMQPAAANPVIMDAATAHRKATAGEITLVDIRTPEEWRETGVPLSAHAISLDQQPKALLEKLDKLVGGDRSRPLALICRTGNRSSFLAGELRKRGYASIVDVSEGVAGSRAGPGWIKTGLPLRKGADIANAPAISASPATEKRP